MYLPLHAQLYVDECHNIHMYVTLNFSLTGNSASCPAPEARDPPFGQAFILCNDNTGVCDGAVSYVTMGWGLGYMYVTDCMSQFF